MSLLALILVSAAPVVIGWLLFFNPHWLPDGRANAGHLIEPAQPIGGTMLRQWNGAELPLAELEGHWVLLMVDNVCGAACRERLWDLRQIRRALGEDRGRVERLLLLSQAPGEELVELLGSEYPGMLVAMLEPGQGHPAFAQMERGSVYLMDPMGNLMMSYRAETPAKAILSDMQRLVRLSRHWGSYVSR